MAHYEDALGPRSRPCFPPPKAEDGVSAQPSDVLVYHPGYEVDREIFRFIAYNKSKDGKGWIDYDFAYDICMAMTHCENRLFHSWKSTESSEG